MKYSFRNIVRYLLRQVWRAYNKGMYRNLGKSSFIDRPLKIEGKKNIYIGNNVMVKYKTWLAAKSRIGTPNPILEIQDGSIIGHFNHIYATKKIIIGKKVLIADRVYISDNLHSFDDPYRPIMDQPIKQTNAVHIGDGTWIGENSCIIGAIIGRNCVIGSNSVVTKDLPDFSIAVGAPAKIIKRYDTITKEWVKINS